jgi:hypothetical protein
LVFWPSQHSQEVYVEVHIFLRKPVSMAIRFPRIDNYIETTETFVWTCQPRLHRFDYVKSTNLCLGGVCEGIYIYYILHTIRTNCDIIYITKVRYSFPSIKFDCYRCSFCGLSKKCVFVNFSSPKNARKGLPKISAF